MVPTCSCERSAIQRVRIKETSLDICLRAAVQWRDKEVQRSCIHTKAFMLLLSSVNADSESYDCDDDGIPEEGNDMIDQLNLDPLLVAVYKADNKDYGIIEKARVTARKKYKCLTCSSDIFSCSHVEAYERWVLDEGVDECDPVNDLLQGNGESVGEGEFECVTHAKYPYPHTATMAERYSMIENRFADLPSCLVPEQPDSTCMHGNRFDDRNPVEQGWVQHIDASIYTKYRKLSATVYYRPTNNCECDCRYFYQGTQDLLLNLDNETLIYMPYIIEYLHDCVEGKMPVAAHIRSVKRTAYNLLGSDCDTVPYKIFSRAFNAAIRLLDIDYKSLFYCKECDETGDGPDTVIIDGKMMGSRKDLMPNFDRGVNEIKNLTEVPEIPVKERVYLYDKKARDALTKYTGFHKSKLGKLKDLTDQEFTDIVATIHSCQPTLGTLISNLGKCCPEKARTFLGQLGIGSPSCAILPIAGSDKTIHLINRVVLEKINLTEPGYSALYDHIAEEAPLIKDFLVYCIQNNVHIDRFINEIIKSILQPFTNRPQTMYTEITEHQNLECFPAYPPVRGRANYASDKKRRKDKESTCRKEIKQHKALTPGLFVATCIHKVTLGFVIMDDFESPKTAFDMIMSRFKKAPKLIVYDNSCQLCTYCLRREPVHFRNTHFAVDRWHFATNHVGCTKGFDLRLYAKYQKINSSMREQENRFLSRISSQIVYMKLGNAMWLIKLFHALRNIVNKQ